ncbi:LytTR family DNA-binding domain-containing protein [Larkinella harenae]
MQLPLSLRPETKKPGGQLVPVTFETGRRFGYMTLLLVAVYVFFASIYFISQFEFKKALANRLGGWDALFFYEVSSILPELVTLFGLQQLVWLAHRLMRLNAIRLTPLGVAQYYLALLPVLLLTFFVVSPFTQTVRFVIETIILYGSDALTVDRYWQAYIVGPYVRPTVIVLYLFLISVLGYCIITVSLVRDLFVWRSRQPDLKSPAPAQPVVRNFASKLAVLSNKGQTVISTSDIAFITVDSPNCLVHHRQGIYKVCNKNLTEMEADLEPELFFRVNRGCLVNREFVEGYVHVGNNNYIVNLKDIPHSQTVTLSRTRLSEFRSWLQISVRTTVIKTN